jgi:hypothetical protein
MTAAVVRLPTRAAAVWLLQASEGGWLVLACDRGWLHGDRRSAHPHWLAWNLGGLPIREPAP